MRSVVVVVKNSSRGSSGKKESRMKRSKFTAPWKNDSKEKME